MQRNTVSSTNTHVDRHFVVNEVSSKVHRMTGDLLAPSISWRTKCGRAFVHAPFRFNGHGFDVSKVPTKNRCNTCLGAAPQP